jgi:hypothetical protein
MAMAAISGCHRLCRIEAPLTDGVAVSGAQPADQNWAWWPLLPLYPFGRRRTLRRELVPGHIWSFEQLQGVFFVAVPIRMTAVKLKAGLLLYSPVAATAECIALVRELEAEHGPVVSIVHPTSSGLEHKVGVPAMARAFPTADVWVTPGQWSFPLPLPLSWLGFPARRTKVLFDDGVPHGDELHWEQLGPLPLGPGPFCEATVLHHASGTLLCTDGLIAVSERWPELLDLDPKPLLYHGRNDGTEPMDDCPQRRLRGWKRLVLFATCLKPQAVEQVWKRFPFRWRSGWEQDFAAISRDGQLRVAPILEDLVFPRQRPLMAQWLRRCAQLPVRRLVPAHFDAPIACTPEQLSSLADAWEQQEQPAAELQDRAFLRAFNRQVERFGLVPKP